MSSALNSLMTVVAGLLCLVVVPGITSAALWRWLSSRNIEKLKDELSSQSASNIERLKNELRASSDVQIESLKSDLRRTEEAIRVRNALLHEKRAEVIVQTFGRIVDLERASIAITSGFSFGSTEEALEKNREARMIAFSQAWKNYYDNYARDVIYFPDDVGRSLKALEELFWEKYVKVNVFGMNPREPSDINQMIIASDHSEVSRIIGKLKADLQGLLGVELAGSFLPK